MYETDVAERFRTIFQEQIGTFLNIYRRADPDSNWQMDSKVAEQNGKAVQ